MSSISKCKNSALAMRGLILMIACPCNKKTKYSVMNSGQELVLHRQLAFFFCVHPHTHKKQSHMDVLVYKFHHFLYNTHWSVMHLSPLSTQLTHYHKQVFTTIWKFDTEIVEKFMSLYRFSLYCKAKLKQFLHR